MKYIIHKVFRLLHLFVLRTFTHTDNEKNIDYVFQKFQVYSVKLSTLYLTFLLGNHSNGSDGEKITPTGSQKTKETCFYNKLHTPNALQL